MTGAAVGMMMSHHDDRSERPYSLPPVSAPAPAPVQSSPAQDVPDDDGNDLDASVAPIPYENAKIAPHAEAVFSGIFGILLDLSVLAALGVGAFFLIRKLRRDKLRRDWQERERSDDRPETSDEYGTAVKDRMMTEWGCPKGLRLGSNMRLQASAFLSDPDAAVPLHVEPAALDHSDGSISIMGISKQSVSNRFDLYPDASEPEFIRIETERGGHGVTDQSGHISSARFFGWIDRITPSTPDEWASWIDDDRGMMGMPSFNTRDGVEWGRVIPGDSRISLESRQERFISASDDKIVSRKVSEVLYARNTGYADGYPPVEYLLLRLIEDRESGEASILIMAGVDISPASLKIVL